MSKRIWAYCASLTVLLVSHSVGAQNDAALEMKYWVCQGGPSQAVSTQYTAIFEGASEEFPSNVKYAHEFCDYISSKKSVSKDGLMCDCNVAVTKALAERWLHDNLGDDRQHFEELRWGPQAAGKGGANAN